MSGVRLLVTEISISIITNLDISWPQSPAYTEYYNIIDIIVTIYYNRILVMTDWIFWKYLEAIFKIFLRPQSPVMRWAAR